MKIFKFEISNSIEVEVEGNSVEEARMYVVEHTQDYADEMVDGSCCISDGEEVAETQTEKHNEDKKSS